MGKLMDILPISDLRQDAAKVLKKLRDKKEPIIITQRSRAAPGGDYIAIPFFL